MTKTNHKIINYDDHTRFGGLIYLSDFDTETPCGDIADRIVEDWKFDEQCRRNAEARDARVQKKNQIETGKIRYTKISDDGITINLGNGYVYRCR